MRHRRKSATSGTLNPLDTVDIGAQVSGRVTKLYADFNSPVKTGDIVAELDQEQLRMKIQQNEARSKGGYRVTRVRGSVC